MASLLDRRLPRIDTRMPVLMTLPRAESPVRGQALNLSERGIFIGTSERCEVGEPLRLSIELAGRPVDVEGRVAWTRPLTRSGAPAGIGVEFTGLDAHLVEQVRAAVGSDREHGIRVRFPGMPSPIRARAAVVGERLSLHTELPFLRLGSVAEFSLEGDAESHRGRIRRVAIEPGGSSDVPRLRIEVEVLGIDASGCAPANARGEAFAAHDDATLAIEIPAAAPQWVEPALEATHRVRGMRRALTIIGTLAAAGVGFAATFAMLSSQQRAGAFSGARQALTIRVPTSPEPATASARAAYEPPRVRGPAAGGPATPADTAAVSPDTATAAVAAEAAEPLAADAASASPPLEATTSAVPATFGSDADPIHVVFDGHRTTTTLVLSAGTTEGVSDYLLSDPSGVAINLPHAELRAEHKVHWTETGAARKIWVRPHDGGTQVRVFYPGADHRPYHVEASGDRIVLTIDG